MESIVNFVKSARVLVDLVVIGVLLFVFLLWVTESPLISLILFFAVLASTTKTYIVHVSPYHAQVLMNAIGGAKRGVLDGDRLKSPLESLGVVIDLRKPIEEKPSEEFSTQGANRVVKMTVSIRPDGSSSASIVKWASLEPGAITLAAKALWKGLLADYFENLPVDSPEGLKRDVVAKKVFLSTEGKEAIRDFNAEHGAKLEVKLEDIARTKAEQDMKDLLSGVASVKDAIELLMKEGGPDGKGMGREEATEYIKLRTLPNTSQLIWKFEAPPTLTSVSVVGGGVSNNNPSGGKK